MDAELISNLLTRDRWIAQHGFSHGKSFSRHPFTGEFYSAHRWMREKYDRRRHAGEQIAQGSAPPSAPDSRHHAHGLDIHVVAAVVEIEESAGPVLAS